MLLLPPNGKLSGSGHAVRRSGWLEQFPLNFHFIFLHDF
jgi:hypothetical protein